jgi:hypothetical protein
VAVPDHFFDVWRVVTTGPQVRYGNSATALSLSSFARNSRLKVAPVQI